MCFGSSQFVVLAVEWKKFKLEADVGPGQVVARPKQQREADDRGRQGACEEQLGYGYRSVGAGTGVVESHGSMTLLCNETSAKAGEGVSRRPLPMLCGPRQAGASF